MKTSVAVPTFRLRKRPSVLRDVIEEENQRAYRERIKAARKARRRARRLRRDLARTIARSRSIFLYYHVTSEAVRDLLVSWLRRQGYDARQNTQSSYSIEINLRPRRLRD